MFGVVEKQETNAFYWNNQSSIYNLIQKANSSYLDSFNMFSYQKKIRQAQYILQNQRLIQRGILQKLKENNQSIELLSKKIDILDEKIDELNNQTKSVDQTTIQTQRQIENEEFSSELMNHKEIKKFGRIHYKTLFKEKIFGVRTYKYKLNIESKISTVLFKQRNIFLKFSLLNQYGHKISNENPISLNLKVYYSNGQEIGQTKKGKNFIKGSVSTTMISGKGSFDKLYPRQVSRKLQKKKIVLIVYASKMANIYDEGSRTIDPSQIEPYLIYGIQVITKQQKNIGKKGEDEEVLECESEYRI